MRRRIISTLVLIILVIGDYTSSSKLYSYYDEYMNMSVGRVVYSIPIYSMFEELSSINKFNKLFVDEYNAGNLNEYNIRVQESAYFKLNIGFGIKCKIHYSYIQNYSAYSNIITHGTQYEVDMFRNYHFIFVYPILLYIIIRLCTYIISISCIIKPRRKKDWI